MRTVGILVCIALAGAGCKSKGDAEAAPDPAAMKAQQDLVARRQAQLDERAKLEKIQTDLELEMEQATAAGSDTSEIVKKQEENKKKLEAQTSTLNTTSLDLDKINTKLDAAGGLASREARMAQREKDLADRERALVDKVTRLAELEAKNADRWKESCSTGGGQTIIQQIAPPRSGTYSRKEVDGLVSKAKATMAKKGLIASDLGAQSSLESEILKALSESDWTRGYVLADQLARTVDQIAVNRPFIKTKMDRLQTRVKAAKVDASTNAQLTAGMGELMQKFGDGDFAAANRKLNQLNQLVR